MIMTCNQTIIAILIAIVVMVPLYFDVRLYSVFDLSKITLLYMLNFILICTWCILRIKDYSTLNYSSLGLPIMVFFAIAIISTCFAIDPSTSVLGTYKRYNGLMSLFVYMFIFFAIINYVKIDMLDLFINVIIITCILICGYGVCQYYGCDFFRWGMDYGRRIFSTIGHPAFLSAYLIMVLPLIYYKTIRANKSMVFVYLACVAFVLITFYLTKTRATFIGLALSSIFFFVFAGFKTNRIRMILLIAVIFGISLFFNLKPGETVYKRFANDITDISTGSNTMTSRYYNILCAVEIVKDYPFFGIGIDNLGLVFGKYIGEVYTKRGKPMSTITERQDRVHSDFFDVLIQVGIIGFVAYIWCIYAYLKMIYCSRNEHRLLIVALSSGVFAYFIQNQFSFGHVPILVLFWFLIGLSVIVCRTDTPIRRFI